MTKAESDLSKLGESAFQQARHNATFANDIINPLLFNFKSVVARNLTFYDTRACLDRSYQIPSRLLRQRQSRGTAAKNRPTTRLLSATQTSAVSRILIRPRPDEDIEPHSPKIS